MPPSTLRSRLDAVVALTDAVCGEVLGDEYAALARDAAEAFAALPGSPICRGKAEGWACGVVRAVGYVNFLSDPASTPHVRTAALAPLFGVSEATAANRDRDVREALDLVRMDPHWTLPSALGRNPMAWMILSGGVPYDARTLSAEHQRGLVEAGMIPFAPADPASRLPTPRWPEPEDRAGPAGPASLDPDAPRLRLHVSLRDVEPAVWRTVVVPSDLPLDGLHEVVQTAMGWEGYHLHSFTAGRRTFGPGLMASGGQAEDERGVTVADVLPTKRSRLLYTYDFGDRWEHAVRLEASLPPAPAGPLFECVDGAGACPPEDCGGPWGYADLLATLADPAHPEHAEMLDWAGGPIDPQAFDLAAANRALAGG